MTSLSSSLLPPYYCFNLYYHTPLPSHCRHVCTFSYIWKSPHQFIALTPTYKAVQWLLTQICLFSSSQVSSHLHHSTIHKNAFNHSYMDNEVLMTMCSKPWSSTHCRWWYNLLGIVSFSAHCVARWQHRLRPQHYSWGSYFSIVELESLSSSLLLSSISIFLL
jgi:hypothetical protein